MRIGIDIDETLCDTLKYLYDSVIKWNRENGGKYEERESEPWDTVLAWSEEDYNDYMSKCYEDTILNMEVAEEIKRVINDWAVSGAEIFIITARGCEGQDLDKITYDWVKKNGINANYIITNVRNKGEFCRINKIDFMIDDYIKNIKDCIESSEATRPILFTGIKENDDADYRDYEVSSWEEINEIVRGGN